MEEQQLSNKYYFEKFFMLSPDLLCIAGFDGYFKRINPAVSKLLEYSDEELFSKPINEFIYPEDRNITSRVRNELTNNIPLYNFENRYVTKSGEIVWLSWTSYPNYQDKIIFAVAKNITYKKKLEEERNQTLANLTNANNSLKQITYKTSHDLRSPVNNLMSILNLMNLSKIKDPEILEYLEMLKLAGSNLQKTLDSYLNDLSKRELLNFNLEKINIHESLERVKLSIKSLIELSNTTIRTDFTQSDDIMFNKEYLDSVFLNLITNAIKYSQPDKAPIISISFKKCNNTSQLIFSDNGLGFDMDKVNGKIFGLYQKFHNHVDSKGIGLYLVYNHINNLGGTISVESKPNEGTTFIITLRD